MTSQPGPVPQPLPVATAAEMAALIIPCRMGTRWCSATCRLTKDAAGIGQAPAGWGYNKHGYGMSCPRHMVALDECAL